jgi:hypothetical protein
MLRRNLPRSALASLLLVACSGSEVPGYTRETGPDGRTIVTYASGLGVAEDTLVALFEIGKYVEDSSSIFEDLRDLTVDTEGRIYALDARAKQIRVYDAQGGLDTTLSRSGEGPGELSQANGLRFGPDGTLWVNDHGKRALLALDRDGRERARPSGIVPGFGYRWNVVIDTAGVLWEPWGRALVGGEPDMEATGLAEGKSQRMFLRYDPAANAKDSVMLDETGFRSYRAAYPNGGGQIVTGLPFASRSLMAIDRYRRVWVAPSDSYTLTQMNLSADTTMELRVSESGVPVSPEDIAEWKEGWQEYEERLPTLIDDLMAYMPTHKSPLNQLFTDDQQRLWVGRTVPNGEPSRWDVFSSEGDLLAVIRAPAITNEFMQPVVIRDRIYLMADGDAGERYIIVATLPGALR